MSSDQAATKDESSGNCKGGGGAAEQAVKCPRCDSPNTKFCYYNNYSLTQPRHFCKTCRRYWTKGGALRNVPIGGGCRKNKKIRPSSSTTRLSDSDLNFFTSPPMLSYPHHYSGASGHYQFSSSGTGLEMMSYPPPNQEMNNKTTSSSSLASSIESLSCINQDLHWKLQQQRLAMLLGDNNNASLSLDQHHHQQKQDLMTMQPILFQNLDISSKQDLSRKEAAGDVATEWFFGNSYANQSTDATRTGGGSWTGAGVQGWTDLQQNHYTALP